MNDLSAVAPVFVDMAHRIVWCTVATIDPSGRPRTRVLHPIWEWDGDRLTGWVATSPHSPKARDLAGHPEVSVTYWDPSQDTCTADCYVEWEVSPEERRAGWDRFANGPSPVGYDPSVIPQWTGPDAPDFGVLRLEPHRLRVMPGSMMKTGEGELLAWSGE
ncbi:MAG: pyridoxamine 5'-phosphate oxidase family protein [Acidimicrobiales bacterium]